MGISFNFVKGSNGNIRGIVFTDDRHNVSFAGGKLDRSLSYGNISIRLSHQSEVLLSKPADACTKQSDYCCMPGSISPMLTVVGENNAVSNDDSSTSGSGIGEAITEIVLQPHVVPTTGGGGTSNDLGWGECDKNKNFKPRKRR